MQSFPVQKQPWLNNVLIEIVTVSPYLKMVEKKIFYLFEEELM